MSNKPIRTAPTKADQDSDQNRAYEIRRDNDTFKSPKITPYDIDYAIMYWLQEVIAPTVQEDGNMVTIPLVYGHGEKWAQIQANGFLQDSNGVQMTPLMVLRRTSIIDNDYMAHLRVNSDPQKLIYAPQRSYSDPLDVFVKLQNSKKPIEYFVSVLPHFVDVEYELIIWTEYVEQMNHVVQDIIPTSGMNWGDTWAFVTEAESFEFETLNSENADRVVTCTIPLKTKGILMDDFEMKRASIQKAYTTKRVVWNDEKSTFPILVDIDPPNGYSNDMRIVSQRQNFFENLLNISSK